MTILACGIFNDYNFILADCIVPRENGLDLADKIIQTPYGNHCLGFTGDEQIAVLGKYIIDEMYLNFRNFDFYNDEHIQRIIDLANETIWRLNGNFYNSSIYFASRNLLSRRRILTDGHSYFLGEQDNIQQNFFSYNGLHLSRIIEQSLSVDLVLNTFINEIDNIHIQMVNQNTQLPYPYTHTFSAYLLPHDDTQKIARYCFNCPT